jgi:hypothetical protein
MLKELIDKLTSYNLFNYLFPGVVFGFLAEKLLGYSLFQNNLVVDAFIFYFIGMVISRFGSLFLEPLLKKIRIVKFADYHDFVRVSAIDPKLEILSEANNSYRTISSMFVLLAVLMPYRLILQHFKISPTMNRYFIVLLLSGLFILSFRKQTQYITKRIESRLKSNLTKDQ